MATQTASQVVESRIAREKIAKIKADTEQKFQKILQQNPAEVAKRMKALQAENAEIAKIADKTERDVRLQILNANMKSVQEVNKTDEADLRDVIFGAKSLVEGMGMEILDLNATTPEEQEVTNKANIRLANANTALQVAKTKWNWGVGLGDKAVAAANAEIALAEQGILDAKSRVDSMKGQRISKADLGANLQTLIHMIDTCTGIMKTRREALEGAMKETILSKDENFDIKQQMASEMTEYSNTIEAIATDLREIDTKLEDLESNSADYVDLEKQKSSKTNELEAVENLKKEALGKFNSCERAILDQEGAIRTQQKQVGNAACLISMAELDVKAVAMSMKNRVETMKALATEEASKILSQIGVAAIEKNAAAMQMAGTQTDDNLLEIFEAQAKNVKALKDIRNAGAEHHADAVRRFGKVYEEYARNYGLETTKWASTGDAEGSSEDKPTDSQS